MTSIFFALLFPSDSSSKSFYFPFLHNQCSCPGEGAKPADSKMDEFRSMAQEICFNSPSQSSIGSYNCYTFTDQGRFESEVEDLAIFFAPLDQTPTVRLGIIPTDAQRRPCISDDALRSLWAPDVGDFDDGALWLYHQYDGYHHFPGAGDIDTFFFGFSIQAMIWTYNRRTLSIKAMLIARLPNLSLNPLARDMSEGAQSLLLLVIERHARHICSPNFMGYSFALSVCFIYDRYDNQYELTQIREIEAATGFQWLGTPLRKNLGIDQLTKWLQVTNQVLIAYSGRKQALNAVTSLLDHLTPEMDEEHLNLAKPALRKRAADSCRHLSEAFPHLRRRIHAYDKYMDYMTFRVERLSSVVSMT